MADSEQVKASEIQVGDLVFFPNSRKAQVVESVVENAASRTFIAADASWTMGPDISVRREIKPIVERTDG